jgi:hypothetical protein
VPTLAGDFSKIPDFVASQRRRAADCPRHPKTRAPSSAAESEQGGFEQSFLWHARTTLEIEIQLREGL